MVAAQSKGNFAIFVKHCDMTADRRIVARCVFAERQIAIIGEGNVDADFGTEFAREIAAIAPKGGPDGTRSTGRTALETAVDVGR